MGWALRVADRVETRAGGAFERLDGTSRAIRRGRKADGSSKNIASGVDGGRDAPRASHGPPE
jgi:hypothetical protein